MWFAVCSPYLYKLISAKDSMVLFGVRCVAGGLIMNVVNQNAVK